MGLLGSSIILLGVPLAMIFSIVAFLRATDRPYVITALLLSALEGILLAVVLGASLLLGE